MGHLRILLGITSFFALASSVLGSDEQRKQQEPQTSTFEIVENYREPRNILFGAMHGGSSHINWVLEILEELSSRSHSTFYITRDDQMKFAKSYPNIIAKSVGPGIDPELRAEWIRDLREKPVVEGIKNLLTHMTNSFEDEYIGVRDFIDSNNIDIAVCDHFGSPCVEASLTAGIPFMVTSSFPQGKDASAPYINSEMFTMRVPTTEFMSLKDRMNDMFIKPLQLIFSLRDNMQRQKQIYMSLGIAPPTEPDQKWSDSIKLVNSAFGFEQGRPVGPLVEFVGPILPKKYPALTPSLAKFLDNHKRVTYIGFGQHAWPIETDGHMIMTALLEALEAGDIDGIVWATRGIKDMFPAYVTTSSNTTYDIQSFYDNEEEGNVLFLNWAPQMAILSHPSTSMFVTHGGAGSLYESFYAGVRVVVYPFFGDQPGAAITTEKNGAGLFLDYKKSQKNANEIVRRVARDEDGKIQASVNRFKTLVQVRSRNGVTRGADIVEEVLFMQVDGGKIPHRWDVKRNMSYIKANNLDIYAFLLILTASIGYGVWNVVAHIMMISSATNNGSHEAKKLKSL